ncbi:TonB-dependent siderophore receptor [Azospirillum doebereinerae]
MILRVEKPSLAGLRGVLTSAMVATALAGTAVVALPSLAQAQETRSYDMPAGPLSGALNRLAEQAGIRLFYDSALTNGLTSPGLKGSFGTSEALVRLLAGTGLIHRRTGPDSFTLEPAPKAESGAVRLDTMQVEGMAGGRETGSSPVPSYGARLSGVGTKTDTPILETPQSISVVTRQAMDNQGALNLADALRYTSGVAPAAYLNGDGTNYDIFTIRGFANSNSGILRDGMRLNYNVFDAASETYGLERIEVLKGPSSVMYGQSGPAGVVNMVSKRPTTTPLHEIEVQGGSLGRRQIATDHGGALDADGVFSYRLTAQVRDGKSWTDFSQDDRTYIAPAFTWRPDDTMSLTLLGYYQKSETSYYSGVPYQGSVLPNPNGRIARNRYLGDPDLNYWNTEAYYIGYLFEKQINKAITVRSGLRYGESKLDYGYLYLDQLLADNRTVTRGAIKRHDDSDTLVADNNIQAKWSGLGGEHTTMAGFDLARSHYQRTRWFGAARSIDLYEPGYGNLGTIAFAAPRIDDPIRFSQAGLYLQQQSKFDDHWVVTLNGRKDWAETVVTARNTQTRTKDDAFTYRAGLTYLAPGGFAPYVSYSESFEPSAGSTWDGSPFMPTTGRQYEAGIKFQPHGSRTLVTLAAYHLTQQNVPTPDPDQVAHPGAQVQTGEIRSRGVELEAQTDLTDNLRLRGALTLTDAEVTKSNVAAEIGLVPVDTPARMASLWADYSIREGRLSGLSFGVGGRYTSGTYDVANSVKLAGRTLVDAMAAYEVDRWRIALTASNIFDRTYINSCYGNCWYGRPRTVDLTLRYSW